MAAPKPTGLRRVLRLARKAIFGLVALVLLVLGVTLIAVHTDWGRNKVRGVIEDQLASTFAGGATVGALEGSVLGDFTLVDVQLFDAAGTPAITIGRLTANAALWKLGSKVAELETLEVEDLKITLGKAALIKPSDAPPSDEPGTWGVQLPSVIVRRGTFELRGDGQPVSLDGIAVAGAIAIPAGGAISVTNLEVGASWREKKLPIVLAGGVELGAGVAIPDAKIKVGELALVVTGLVIDTQQPTGTVKITGSPQAIAAVAPQIELPAGLDVELIMKPSGRAADVLIAGTFGDATIHGALHGDLANKTVAGWLGAGKINLRRLLRSSGTRPPINVRGELALAVTADTKGIKGILGVHGSARDLPESDATIVIDATWKDAGVTLLAVSEGDAMVAVNAHAKRDGKRIEIDRARVVASAKELAPATGDRVPLVAQQLLVDVKLGKPGTVAPTIDLAFEGNARGTRLVYDDISIAGFDTQFAGAMRDKLYVQSTTRVRGASQAGTALGSGTIAANLLPDGRIFTRVDVKPAAAAVGVVASGYITPGAITTIALADHAITPQVGTPWSGKGGTITIDPARDSVDVREIITSSGAGGRARLDAKLVAGTLDASVDAQGLPVAAVDPAYRGTVSGKLAIKRRGVRWDGGGTLVAAGVVIDPTLPVFEGDITVGVAGRLVTLDAHAKSAEIGATRLELQVEGPRDLTDVAAWKRLERTAVKTAAVTVDKVNLDAVSTTGGKVDGKVTIGGANIQGSVEVKGVATPLGTAEGTVSFSPLGKDLFASWNALLSDVGEASIGVRIAFPQYPFDPAAWRQLGRGVVQSLTASFDDIAVDPVKLAKLGITVPYSGRADVRIAVGAAATAATIDVDLRTIEGGALVKPINVHAEATTDATGTVASACVARAKDPGGDACAKGLAVASVPRLLEIKGVKVPVTFDAWIAAPKAALGATLEGTIAIPSQSAPALMALVGRNVFENKKDSTLEGTIAVGGTLGKPTGKAAIAVNKLQLISHVEGRTIPELTSMTIDAVWDGVEGDLKVVAKESNKGEMRVTASAKPDRLAEGTGSFKANHLDLAPLAAFLPGELAASQGELNGLLTIKGFDPSTMRADGAVTVDKADVPLDPMIGTLRNGKLKLFSTPRGYSLTAQGLLNSCKNPENPRCTQNINLDASTPLDLATLEATLIAEKISTIGEIEPVLDAKARIALTRTGREWSGDIYITGRNRNESPSISVPKSTGDDLLDFESPDDIYFTDKPPKQIRFSQAEPPTKAWLDARVHLASTSIDVAEYGVRGAIIANEPLRLLLGDHIGLDGKISIEYGTANDIFGRSYEIEQNDLVNFDGTIDPTIDLQLTHRFPELTLRVSVQGRLSDADFPTARFTADQGTYSEAELFGFFLGGDPGGTTATQAQDAAKGAGSSLLSRFVAQQLKELLPENRFLRFDVLACEPGASNTGGSCTVGRRFFDGRLYISLKHRLAPLPNENGEEVLGQFYLSTEWFLEATGGTSNIIGADLLWRRRW